MSLKTSKINYNRYVALMTAMDEGPEAVEKYDARIKKQKEKKDAQKLKVRAHSFSCSS